MIRSADFKAHLSMSGKTTEKFRLLKATPVKNVSPTLLEFLRQKMNIINSFVDYFNVT